MHLVLPKSGSKAPGSKYPSRKGYRSKTVFARTGRVRRTAASGIADPKSRKAHTPVHIRTKGSIAVLALQGLLQVGWPFF